MNLKINLTKDLKILLVVFIITLFFRVIGANSGFPVISHPDEPSVIRSALGIRFELNPKHFDWPHLYFYLNFFVFMAFAGFRNFLELLSLKDFLSYNVPLIWNDPYNFYFISRILTSIIGALTIFPIYYAGKTLFNNKVGLISAGAFSILPFHVWHSHYALIDVPMVFFVSLALVFAAKIIVSDNFKAYIFSGLFIGFAASTKYNGGLSCIMVPLALCSKIYYSSANLKAFFYKAVSFVNFKNLVLSGLFCILGFLIGTPYAILDSDTFLITDNSNGALWQFTNVGSIPLSNLPLKIMQMYLTKLMPDMGYTTTVTFVVGLALFVFLVLKNKLTLFEKQSLVFLYVMGLFLTFYISKFEKSRSHYFMLSYPFIVIAASFWIYYFVNNFKKLLVPILVTFFTIPFVFTLLIIMPLFKSTTYQDLNAWLKNNLTVGDTIIYQGSKLEPILDFYDTSNEVKKSSLYSATSKKKGYVILAMSQEDLQNHLNQLGDDYKEFGKRLERVLIISANNKIGDNIVIYKFDRINDQKITEPK